MTNDVAWLSNASFERPESMPPSAWMGHAPFAFWLVQAHRPQTIVELGTYYGFSYLCFCQQVKAGGLPTRCTAIDTWEGDVHAGQYDDSVYQQLKQYHDTQYGRFSQLIRSRFDDAVDQFADGSIDLLHIDGRHFYDDVKHDWTTWRSKLSDRGIVLFHDTRIRERDFGVWKLWQEVSGPFPTFEFLHSHGLGVLGTGTAPDVRALPVLSSALDELAKDRIRKTYEILGHHVQTAQPLRRIDPCPCGSGQRYKHCHGKIA
jgi:Methyltransferase domain/SEC-C motif